MVFLYALNATILIVAIFSVLKTAPKAKKILKEEYGEENYLLNILDKLDSLIFRRPAKFMENYGFAAFVAFNVFFLIIVLLFFLWMTFGFAFLWWVIASFLSLMASLFMSIISLFL